MTEPDTRTHGEILLDLVRSRTSALGDKTWGMDELAEHTGLRPHQVSNAVARIVREAKRDNELPLLRSKTGAKGQYVYTGPLKRGRKPSGAYASTPTEEVPFTEEALEPGPLSTEGHYPRENEVASKPTIAEGFAQVGEKLQAAMGDVSVALGVAAPSASAVNQAMDAEKVAVKKQTTALRNNRVSRVRRLMTELAQEMRYLENEWDALVEKGRRYDKLTMTMFGFSSNDPTAVDREAKRD